MTRLAAAALLAALLLGGATVTSPAVAVASPRPAAADPADPPPLHAAAPSGARPGPAAGLRSAERCVPPASDAAQAAAGSGAERMRLADLHRLATGAGQVVAVIDTGVARHPRLGSRLRGAGDYLTGGDGRTDCDGHGTAVAGIIVRLRHARRTARGAAAVGQDRHADRPRGRHHRRRRRRADACLRCRAGRGRPMVA